MTTTIAPDERILKDGRRIKRVGPCWCAVEPFDVTTLGPGKARPPSSLHGGVGQLLDVFGPDGVRSPDRLVVTVELHPFDHAAEHRRLTTGEGRRFLPLDVGPADPVAPEVSRLEEMGLHESAKAVRAASPAPEPDPLLALLGTVEYDAKSCHALGFNAEFLEPLLRRHAAGDWGVIGRLDDVEIGDDERLLPEAFGPEVRNAVALDRRRGMVRSVYAVAIVATSADHAGGPMVLDGARGTSWGWDKAPYGSKSCEIRIDSFPGQGATLVYCPGRS